MQATPATPTLDVTAAGARRLAAAIEPFAAQVYFAPECHEHYVQLGFSPSTTTAGNVAMPDGPAYFTSRGAVMGQVASEVVAAAFGVFNPAVVVRCVDHGWTLTDATTICQARTAGAVAQLTRILGPEPDGLARATELLARATAELAPAGRPLFAGLRSLGLPGSPIGDAWRLADQLREFRGDSHIAAWNSAGFDAPSIGLITELYWGLPMRTYIRTRAWRNSSLDKAEARLVAQGLVADGALTDDGRVVREAIELSTDRQCAAIVEALGDELDELVALLQPWGAAIRAAGGYPASGPHDLAAVRSTAG